MKYNWQEDGGDLGTFISTVAVLEEYKKNYKNLVVARFYSKGQTGFFYNDESEILEIGHFGTRKFYEDAMNYHVFDDTIDNAIEKLANAIDKREYSKNLQEVVSFIYDNYESELKEIDKEEIAQIADKYFKDILKEYQDEYIKITTISNEFYIIYSSKPIEIKKDLMSFFDKEKKQENTWLEYYDDFDEIVCNSGNIFIIKDEFYDNLKAQTDNPYSKDYCTVPEVDSSAKDTNKNKSMRKMR